MAGYKKISEFGNVTPVSTDLYLIEKADGTYSYVTGAQLLSFFGAGFELTSNKQNSLAVDGTGSKYVTVDAVNTGLANKQDTLVSGTNIRTVNGSTLLGSTNLQVGTILGTLPATAGYVPFGNGTLDTVEVLNGGVFGYGFRFLKNNIQAGNTRGALIVGSAFNGFAGNFHATTDVSGTLMAGYTLEDTNNGGGCYIVRSNNTSQASFYAYGTSMPGVHAGTSINLSGTNGIISSNTFSYNPTGLYVQKQAVLINITGSTSTNIGTRLDATGLRIGAISTLHTANSAVLDIAHSNTTRASLRIRTGVAPTTPNDGDIWFDGTDIKMRVGGVTKTFTLV